MLSSPDRAIDVWLGELASQRRQSPHTIEACRRDLLRLLDLAGETALRDLQAQHIRRFLGQLHARGLSGRSLARVLSSWRGFFRWLALHGAIPGNPVAGIRPPKSPRALPKALSPDEAHALLERGGDHLLSVRDRAMFELLYSSGLRLAELAALDITSLGDIAEGEIRVLGKRSKPRIVPVGSKAREALQTWAAQRGEFVRPGRADEPALFLSRNGTRLSPRAIQIRLERHAREAGLPTHVHPHMLRHSFASHLLQASGDLRAVQEMLGHASIASTQVYTHLDFEHLTLVYDSAHPRARRRK
jgi:integrase/recombinase XerC